MAVSKYTTLANYLQNQTAAQITLPFATVEDILGFLLPKSARKYRPWWANDSTHTHAENGWLRIGWQVVSIDMNKEIVQFKRVDQPQTHLEFLPDITLDQRPSKGITAARIFQEVARKALTSHFGIELRPRQIPYIPKLFDYVSADHQIIGDAKYYSMVKGHRIPPAKFSTIAEHVWLLEKTEGKRKFLIFGNDQRVPEGWLTRYGNLVSEVEFYFLDKEGHLTRIN